MNYRCHECGKESEDVEWRTDPWEEVSNQEEDEVCLCEDCYQDLVDGI